MLQGAIIGIVVGVAMMLWNRHHASKGTGLAGAIDEAMRDAPSGTLAEIARLVNKDTFLGRGEVAQALGALQQVGKVRVIQAPEGTPQLKKVDFIRYERVNERAS